jgi:hypothetical protein
VSDHSRPSAARLERLTATTVNPPAWDIAMVLVPMPPPAAPLIPAPDLNRHEPALRASPALAPPDGFGC